MSKYGVFLIIARMRQLLKHIQIIGYVNLRMQRIMVAVVILWILPYSLGMRNFQFINLMCSFVWVFTPVLADQNNPRLDVLFTQLKGISTPNELALIESKIWVLGTETSDQAAGALLQTGIDAMRSSDLGGALEAFDQVVAIAPDFAEGRTKRATAHYILGNYEQSLHIFNPIRDR